MDSQSTKSNFGKWGWSTIIYCAISYYIAAALATDALSWYPQAFAALRGWGEGDVIIEGDTDLEPENFSYDRFIFMPDGKYNGMMRSGSFSAYDEFGDIIYEGTYRCDNNNLKLVFTNEEGRKQTILAQVLSFTDDTMTLRYENEEYNVTVTLILRKAAVG